MLLDTSGLFCYYHLNEIQHSEAVRYFGDAPVKLTHSYVLAEFVPLCHARGMSRIRALSFASELMANTDVEIVWVDQALHREAMLLLQHRLDKTYSLCDAVSMVLMNLNNISEALTTDRHFEQEGFVRLLRP